MRDRSRNQVKVNARVDRNQYLCAQCKTIVGNKETQIDHIEPVTPLTGWDGFDNFIERLWVPAEKMQLICKKCHKIKSKEENEIRRTSKRSKKRAKKNTK